METIIYGILGLVILLGSSFLFTYYGTLNSDTKTENKMSNPSTAEVGTSKIQRAKLSRITIHKKIFPAKKKHPALSFGIFAFLLFRRTKKSKKQDSPEPA
jgi:hypothetical protein